MADGRITICDLLDYKRSGRKFAAVSCYDYTTARLVAAAGVEMILVGDSAAQVILGYDSTLPVTMDFMTALTAGVRRGAPNVCLVADMPFLSYQTSVADAVRNAGRFVQEAGAQVIKIEATAAHLEVVRAVSDAGMAVMAHIGIRPQSITAGTAQGRGDDCGFGVGTGGTGAKDGTGGGVVTVDRGDGAGRWRQSLRPKARCRWSVADRGRTATANSDHQRYTGPERGKMPKFAQAFGQLAEPITAAVAAYADQVRSGTFPDDAHCYHIRDGELDKLENILNGR